MFRCEFEREVLDKFFSFFFEIRNILKNYIVLLQLVGDYYCVRLFCFNVVYFWSSCEGCLYFLLKVMYYFDIVFFSCYNCFQFEVKYFNRNL